MAKLFGLALIEVNDILHTGFHILHTGFHIHVGSRVNTSFWNDIWCGQRCLKETFPRLFGLSSNKEANMRDLLCNSEDVNGT